ncbi:MAG: thioredoxin family protein [Chloroflexota bacterium]
MERAGGSEDRQRGFRRESDPERHMMKNAWNLTIAACIAAVMLFVQIGESTAIDDALSRAKSEGRAVMLELGSLGCTPCEQMRPVMARLSKEYAGKLDVIFVDVKKDIATARKYGVHAIPTQVFLDRGGREFSRHLGFFSYEDIKRQVLNKMGL